MVHSGCYNSRLSIKTAKRNEKMNFHNQQAILWPETGLTLGPRPRVRAIKRLPQQVVFTLLNPEENPGMIEEETLRCGKGWVGAPLDARGHSMSDWPNWLAAVIALEKVLKSGATVYLHCAAGIHRTGSLAYLYFRRDGYSQSEAKRRVFALRPIIEDEIGNKMDRVEEMFRKAVNKKTIRDYYEEGK